MAWWGRKKHHVPLAQSSERIRASELKAEILEEVRDELDTANRTDAILIHLQTIGDRGARIDREQEQLQLAAERRIADLDEAVADTQRLMVETKTLRKRVMAIIREVARGKKRGK